MAQNSIARLAVQIVTDTAPLSRGMNVARQQILQFSGSLSSVSQGASSATSAIGALGASLGAAAIVAGTAAAIGALVKFGQTGVAVAAQLEQAKISFEVLTGSAKEAGTLINDLRSLAAETPLDFMQVNTAAKTLLAMGEDTKALTDELMILGNISAATGQPLNELAQVFGQVMQAGRLTGNELRQFNERGVPLLTELSQMLGVSKSKIRELVEAGEITSAQVVAAFEKMAGAGGRFAGMMARQTDTLIGQWNKFKENISILAGEVFEPLAMAFKEILSLSNESLSAILKMVGVDRARASTTADKEAIAALRAKETAIRESEKAADEAAKAEESRMKAMKSRADAIIKSLRTPGEAFGETIIELKSLADAGLITAETLSRGITKASEDYRSAALNVKKLKEELKFAPALEIGTQAARTAILQFQSAAKRSESATAKASLEVEKRIAAAVETMAKRPPVTIKAASL